MSDFKTGDQVVFTANGVTGTVVRNLGPAVNTLTGTDLIEWFVPGSDGGLCVHDASKLARICGTTRRCGEMSGTVEPCNNTSVGILVVRDDRLLLIERRRPPYGWAPPAGHVDAGETYPQAARRELWEEVGLVAERLFSVYRARYENQCRRPGGDHHNWEVFGAATTGESVRSEDETSAIRWVGVDELVALREVSLRHLISGAGPDQWRAAPGLEPVWMQILERTGWNLGSER